MLRSLFAALVPFLALGLACTPPGTEDPDGSQPVWGDGKADGYFGERAFEVLLTQPFCDVCTSEEKAYLEANSPIVARAVELIEGAKHSIEVAQFSFSSRVIENALYRANDRNVRVRVAMDFGQNRVGSLARRMQDNGIDVRFVRGNESGGRFGLMHSKFMVVDDRILLSGSNNWSSTGVSINEENTIVLTSESPDPLLRSFACHFESAWENEPSTSSACSSVNARFSPGVGGRNLIRDELRAARESVDVLMHHLLLDHFLDVLAEVAAAGVRVRVVLNLADRETYSGGRWDRLIDAGGQVRFKRNAVDQFQYMHHKLAIIDGRMLLHGSGNWSGSAFFNNYEFFVRYHQREVVRPFTDLYERLWDWSLGADALDRGWSAARQHHDEHQVFFGSLHAHYEEFDEDGKMLDDGELLRSNGEGGELFSVHHELGGRHVARYAYEYARDVGAMDFMTLSPHVTDDRDTDPLDLPSMSVEGYANLVRIARDVTRESGGSFIAVPAMEWNSLAGGNHVNIYGTDSLSKVERGRFDLLYEGFLPKRAAAGERPLMQFNHPRTFRRDEETLSGNWDQIYDINLLEIPNASQRSQKFTDFGLDDYPPLKDVHDSWIAGDALPSRQIVAETLANIDQVTQPFLRLMEVTISRGTDIAHEDSQNPSWTERNGEPFRYTRVESDWHYYLLHGFRLAPTAGHDNHYANWGSGHSSRTAVIARELSEKSILDAIDRRQVYASEDQNMAIALYASERVPMGASTATLANHIDLHLIFQDPDHEGPFSIRVVRGRVGDEAATSLTHIHDVTQGRWGELTVPLPTSGEYFVYVVVHDTGAERKSWTAPIWVTRL